MHILHVTRDSDVGRGQGLGVLDVESDTDLIGCPDCGVVAVGYGRRVQVLSRRPVLRHAGAGAVAQADLALPRTLVSSRNLGRGARRHAAAGQAHQPGGGVGPQHIWRPSRISSADKSVTVMVDLTRGPNRRLSARLLDAVQGRSGTVRRLAQGGRGRGPLVS